MPTRTETPRTFPTGGTNGDSLGISKYPDGGDESETDFGTVVGVPVVLLLSCCILAIMFYCRCYRPLQRKKTLERAHVTYIADPSSRPGNHNLKVIYSPIIQSVEIILSLGASLC